MTTEKHDPWALLREARRLIHTALSIDALQHWACESNDGEVALDDEMRSLRTNIDAALAERQDSTTDVVESELDDGFGCCGGSDETPPEHTQDCPVHPPDCYLCKKTKAVQQIELDDAYASVCLKCAKSAAIAAARGTK